MSDRTNDMAAATAGVVESVTVFADRALVTRKRRVALAPGQNRILFSDLASGILAESVKAGLQADGVSLSSAALERETLWQYREEDHRAAWTEAKAAVAALAELLDAKAVYGLERRAVDELGDYLRQSLNAIMMERDSSMPKLREALAFIADKRAETTARLLAIGKDFDEGERKLARLRETIDRIDRLDRRERCSIALVVEADKAVEMDARVSYIVPDASWRPEYDSFLDTAGKRVTLRYSGAVRQATGESWNDATVYLSTAAVRLSPEVPPVYPVSVSTVERQRTKTIVVSDKSIDNLDGFAEKGEGTTGAEPEPEAPSDAPARRQEISAVFTAADKASIPSDGVWHKVLILERAFDAECAYETVPELLEFVYLKASFVNATGLPFLAGDNNLYRNGSYVGRAPLPTVAATETARLSFGIDEDLRVKRIVLEDRYDPATGLIGKNRAWKTIKFTLSNYRGSAESVVVKEAAPLSELKEVEVKLDEATSPGYERDKEGIVSWKVALGSDPAVLETRTLRYVLESPKSFDLGAVVAL